MALYSNGTPGATSSANPARRVTGQYLAKAHLTTRQRAKLAAELTIGTAVINPLTVKQAAAVARVPVLNVSRARRNGHNGARADNGVAALVAALRDGTDAERGKVVRTIGEFLLRMTPTDRIDTARAVGVDWIWDHMIAPVIAEERVSQQAAE